MVHATGRGTVFQLTMTEMSIDLLYRVWLSRDCAAPHQNHGSPDERGYQAVSAPWYLVATDSKKNVLAEVCQ